MTSLSYNPFNPLLTLNEAFVWWYWIFLFLMHLSVQFGIRYLFPVSHLATILFSPLWIQVVDEFGGKGNVLNFNVGDGVKCKNFLFAVQIDVWLITHVFSDCYLKKVALPNVFWTRLTSKYGTVSYFTTVVSLVYSWIKFLIRDFAADLFRQREWNRSSHH